MCAGRGKCSIPADSWEIQVSLDLRFLDLQLDMPKELYREKLDMSKEVNIVNITILYPR